MIVPVLWHSAPCSYRERGSCGLAVAHNVTVGKDHLST